MGVACGVQEGDVSSEREAAEMRAREAWDARFRHARAASTWDAIARERPEHARVNETLARWMAAYADSDAEAERAFLALATEAR